MGRPTTGLLALVAALATLDCDKDPCAGWAAEMDKACCERAGTPGTQCNMQDNQGVEDYCHRVADLCGSADDVVCELVSVDTAANRCNILCRCSRDAADPCVRATWDAVDECCGSDAETCAFDPLSFLDYCREVAATCTDTTVACEATARTSSSCETTCRCEEPEGT